MDSAHNFNLDRHFLFISIAAVVRVVLDMAGIVVVLVVVEDILDIVAGVRQQDIVDNQDK